MIAVKSHQADAFIAARDRLPSALLVYGPDAGLVSERAGRLAKGLAAREDPPGEIVRLSEASLEEDPDRLFVELQTAPMFGGRKIVLASAGRRVTAQALKALLEGTSLAGSLIVEAGSLRPDEALRALFEGSPRAAAIACFADEARDLDRVIAETLTAARLEIDAEARRLLIERLGADRALSRSELEKLALFAYGKARIGEDDIEAVVGDAAELALDRIVMAAVAGQNALAVAEYDRSLAAGESAQTVILALQRHFLRLHRLRAALDQGRPLEEVLRGLRPPPPFRQRALLERQARTWSAPKLAVALAVIADAAKAARLNGTLETALAQMLLLRLGALAAAPPAAHDRRQR